MPGAESEESEKVAALAHVYLNQSVLHTWGTQAVIHSLLVECIAEFIMFTTLYLLDYLRNKPRDAISAILADIHWDLAF